MAKRTRAVIGVQRRYVWRLYLTPEQREVLHEQAGMCADLWNALLSMCEQRYSRAIQRCGRSISFHCADCAALSQEKKKLCLCDRHKLPDEFDMGYWVTEMLAQCPEWRELSTWTPRRVAGSLSAAWQAFFRRIKNGEEAGYPRYKSRHRHLAIPHRCISGCTIRKSDRHERSWTVRLKGVPGEVWARGKLPADVNEWMDADIRLDRNEISVAIAIDERRESCGRLRPVTVRFDLIDGFAIVNNETINLDGLIQAKVLDDRRAAMQSDFDVRWPRGKRYSDDEWEERCEAKAAIGRLSSRVARVRSNALHVWSAQLVERASVITLIKPQVKDNTKTPRGNRDKWGASVEAVSTLNRSTLSYAPAMAAAMVEYKAKELGIRCEVKEDRAPSIAVGNDLVVATKTLRRAKRVLKKEMADGV